MRELALPSGAPAYYRWSTMMMTLDKSAPPEFKRLLELNLHPSPTDHLNDLIKSTIGEFATDLGRGGLPKPWRNVAEAEADIFFRHEVTHFIQDIATGLGMWDEFHLQKNLLNWLSSWSKYQSWQGLEDFRISFVTEQKSRFLFARPASKESESVEIRDRLLRENGIVEYIDETMLLTRSVLEADAVTEVAIHVASMLQGGDSHALKIASSDSISSLWFPLQMPIEYRGWVGFWLKDVHEEAWNIKSDIDLTFNLIRFLCENFQLLLDLSLAYPPPRYFEKINEKDHVWLDPSVKLACLIQAYNEMSESEGMMFSGMVEGIIKRGEIEEMLLRKCNKHFAYPSSTEIYNEWMNEFVSLKEAKGSNIFLEARFEACKARSKFTHSRRDPLFSDLITFDLWWRQHGTLPKPAIVRPLPDLIQPPNETLLDLVDRWLDLELLALLLSEHTFICPFAGTNCEGQKLICGTGINLLEEFPLLKCYVRHRYGESGIIPSIS